MPANSNAPAAHGKPEATPRKRTKLLRQKAKDRPAKPTKDYPLYAHPLGYWSKKINSKIIHFGRWGRVAKGKLEKLPDEQECADSALAAYNKFKTDAEQGRIEGYVVSADDHPVVETGECLVKDVCNQFLNAKLKQMTKPKGKRLGQRMYDDYQGITELICKQFGNHTPVAKLTSKDFEALREHMANKWGPVRLTNSITRVKTVFKYAYEIELIPKPIPCLQPHGTIFAPPSADEIRKGKNKHELEHGQNVLTAAECRTLIDSTSIPVKAMILLGLNCGFGNHDCATLPLAVLQLDSGWIAYPRPKTGVQRRCPLWPETVTALRAVLAERPKPKTPDDAEYVFLMPNGAQWLCRGIANPVTLAAGKAMRAAKVHRKGLGFYTLRHVFRTEADATLDFPAVRLIMGHSDPNKMDDKYRVKIDDSRLLAVTNHVRKWLLDAAGGEA